MKIPEKPPNWVETMAKSGPAVFSLVGKDPVKGLLRKSLDEYPYWDKLKHWPMPPGVTPEIFWALREMAAMGRRQAIPLVDTKRQNFSFWLPDRAQELLHHIDRGVPMELLGEGELPTSEEREKFIVNSLMEESIASSQIEGAATSRKAAKEMLRSGRKPTNKSERMILNNYQAITRIRELRSEPLTLDLMHELHRILTDQTLDEEDAAGRFRRSPDDDILVLDHDQTILHEPPAGKDLSKRMEAFLSFANEGRSEFFIHPIVHAILLHFWIGYDHPYIDGNGRTARGVFYWYLLRKGYWLFEYLSISRIVLRTFGQYKRAYLYSELTNDATYFLMYNLSLVKKAVEDVRTYLHGKQLEQKASTDLLRRHPNLNHRQRDLLLEAVRKPGVTFTFQRHQTTHQISYQTARTDLLDLAKAGFLQATQSGKQFIFLPPDDLARRLKAAAAPPKKV